MSRFRFKAKEGPDKVVDGTIEADNEDAAVSLIVSKGLAPIDVFLDTQDSGGYKKIKPGKTFKFIKQIKFQDIVLFTRQLSDLVEASVPILRSLQVIHKQTRNLFFKERIHSMYELVRDGEAFSDALSSNTDIFSAFYINLVRAAELSGKLKEVLKRLADHLENEQQIRSRVQASLAYPMLIMVVGILTMFVLLSFVIPRLVTMFEDMGQQLPFLTRALILISGFFASFWWLIIIVFGLAALYIRQFLSTSQGRLKFDTWKLRVPILGNFVRYVEVGRLARTLGTLIESGVVITDALNSVWSTVDNIVLKEELMEASNEVRDGSSLNEALANSEFFPEMALNMISVGEETGHLEHSFHKIADTYERQSDQIMKVLVSLLGPVMLFIIMIFVFFVVLSMILPIMNMDLFV